MNHGSYKSALDYFDKEKKRTSIDYILYSCKDLRKRWEIIRHTKRILSQSRHISQRQCIAELVKMGLVDQDGAGR